MKKWTRTDKIGVWALVLTVVAVAVAVTIPEIRRWIGLDKPNPAPTAPVVEAKKESPPSVPEAQTPKPKKPSVPSQSTKVKVKGNNDVAGNNTSGNNNAVGNNNTVNAPAINQNGHNNIAQFGNGNRATINEREHLSITPEVANRVTERLRPFAGRKITIQLNKETQESSTFGNTLTRAFQNAGLDVETTHITILVAVPPGVALLTSKSNPDRDFVQAVIDVLTDEGLAKNPMPGEMSEHLVSPLLRITPIE
jgi:hypothetical protein